MLSFLFRGACPFGLPAPPAPHDSGKWGTIPLQPQKCPTSQRNRAPHRSGILPHFKRNQCPTSTGIRTYLLRGTTVARVNQVWSTDITYIRMAQGFLYLVAIMDWFSRFVLSW